ncbi:MAG: protein kinase domain-containing protein, partial [Planctomycetota bacterium]
MTRDKAQPPQSYRREPPPDRIGPYRILDVLGEGGMGIVYVAEQKEPIRRRVALKVIKLGMDSEEILRRFAAERQALAMMEHDNIAKVLDAGTTERGQPYFAMEHVPGIILTEYADVHRLTTSERLELFQQVCEGVQHAHQKGVIHRDLKPSNILVTETQGRPVPKIIDFGVAKATDHRLSEQTLYTREGRLIGTLEYMSPEQADLTGADIDTRTDIYSLGAILYELLVGQLPYSADELAQAGFSRIQSIIQEEEAPRPSTRITQPDVDSKLQAKRCRTTVGSLVKELRGGLDWIAMRAMEKERSRRYATATSLKEDIDRYLSHQPVLAGPPSTAYKLKKFIRRNRLQVISGAVVLLALVAGTIGTSIGFLRAAEEAEERAAQAQQAQEERNRAEELTSFMLFDLWDRLAPIGRLDLLEQVALSAKEYYEGRSLDDLTEEARRKLALAWMSVGNVLHSQGHLEDARSAYSTAREIQAELLALDASNATLRADYAHSQTWIGQVQRDQGNLEAALDLYRSAGEILQDLTSQPSSNIDFMGRLEENHSKIADVLKEQGDLEGALAEYRRSLDIQEELVDRYPGNENAQNDLARIHTNIGVVFRNQGDLGEAIKSYQRALDIREALLTANPDNIAWKKDLSSVYNNMGGVLSDRGDTAASDSNYKKSLSIREELVVHDPYNKLWKNELAGSYHNWGSILRGRGDWEGALDSFRKALSIREELVAQDPSNTSWQADLARTSRNMGNL